ncbi:MAG: class I SAM-dependent methyltransferase [Pygmaiobacter sp.]|nr:class I SAM-dependent methyltransferase [Pygmaiobacter sp.]
MVQSKAWAWGKVGEKDIPHWKTPATESYYLASRWQQQAKQDFLDLGCGLGRHSVFFAKNGFRTSAFDLSRDAVEQTQKWARAEHLAITGTVGDMLALPYPDASFDCIFCKDVLSHTDTQGVKKIAADILRILKPAGECYLTLGSKKAWGFGQPWPVVDENTKIRIEAGPENGIPHFYADIGLIEELFQKFTILSAQQVQDYINDGTLHSIGWHWHVLIQKPEGA